MGMDYDEILSEVFVGSYPSSVEDVDRLRQEVGVTAVLNLRTDEDMSHFGLDWQEIVDRYTACGITVKRVAIRDFDPVDLRARLAECTQVLDELLEAGHTVYVHCTAGTGRSPSVVIAYLSWYRRWDLDDAFIHVSRRRHCSPNMEAIRLAAEDRAPASVRQEENNRAPLM
jgi:protein-tyrosine phosphatase